MSGAKVNSRVIVGANNFGVRLLRQLDGSGSENTLISPLSITSVLDMLYDGSAGQNAKQITDTLGVAGIPARTVNLSANASLAGLNKSAKQVQFSMGNGIWIAHGTPLMRSYPSALARYYGAPTVTYAGPAVRTANEINQWISNRTAGHITNLVLPPQAPDKGLLLVNALYFHGSWATPFKQSSDKHGPFYVAGRPASQTIFMNQAVQFPYFGEKGLQAVQLPYATARSSSAQRPPANSYALDVYLPSDMRSFLASLTGSRLAAIDKQMQGAETVDLSLPKFSVSYKSSLKPALRQMGTRDMFACGGNNFPGISAEPICIVTFEHQATIDVNEHGATATAATVAGGADAAVVGPPPPTVHMRVNRPFVYTITNTETGQIVFLGVEADPTD